MSWIRPTIRGALTTAAPALPAIVIRVYGPDALASVPRAAAVFSTSIVWMVAGLLLSRAPRLSTLMVLFGFLAQVAVLLPVLVDHPAIALASLMFGLAAVLGLDAASAMGPERAPSSRATSLPAARMASATVLLLWLSIWPRSALLQEQMVPWLAPAFLVAIGWVLLWMVQTLRSPAYRLALIALIGGAIGLALPLAHGSWNGLFSSTAGLLAMAVIALPRARGEAEDWLAPFIDHPARLLVSTFAFLSLAGTVLLLAPWASSGSSTLSLSAAGFTAVSAVCVTGLTVIDPSRDLSFAGQVSLLVLIQLGGLGIMTFSTAALRLLGRRMSLKHEAAVAGLVSAEDRSQIFDSTLRVIRLTFACEAAGALAIGARFAAAGQDLGTAIWKGIFTSVSAFCNAGFALDADSLVGYQSDPLILHVVAVLIILGGLSPAVVVALPALLLRRRAPLRAQKRLVVATNIVLLLGGTVLYAALEWSHSLTGLSAVDRFHNAWFQSVTLRTAGFNSVDLTTTHPATITFMWLMMFIGGSPGGTAGGVKTTTVAVLVLAVMTAIRGRRSIVAYGRTIPHESVYRAAAISTMGLLTVVVSALAIQLTQPIPDRVALFEVVSAIGTVGLSLGATPLLDDVGRVLIMACMFMGRVGPLTLFMLIGERRPADPWKHPVEEVDVG